MPFNALALNVMLAGPGDVIGHVRTIEDTLYAWTRERAVMSSVVLVPRHWTNSTVSSFGLGQGGQAEINQQLVDEADIIFAVFHAKLGTATNVAVSGTAEEIEKAIDAGTKVHVFFSKEPVPHDADIEQLAALRKFKAALGSRGYYREFANDDELKGLVRSSIEVDVPKFEVPVAIPDQPKEGARLDARYEYREVAETDSKGRVRTKKKGERIVVRNSGKAPASNVTVELEPVGQGTVPYVMNGEELIHFETIAAGSEVSIPIAMMMGTAQNLKVTFNWDEDGELHSFSHTMSFH